MKRLGLYKARGRMMVLVRTAAGARMVLLDAGAIEGQPCVGVVEEDRRRFTFAGPNYYPEEKSVLPVAKDMGEAEIGLTEVLRF